MAQRARIVRRRLSERDGFVQITVGGLRGGICPCRWMISDSTCSRVLPAFGWSCGAGPRRCRPESSTASHPRPPAYRQLVLIRSVVTSESTRPPWEINTAASANTRLPIVDGHEPVPGQRLRQSGGQVGAVGEKPQHRRPGVISHVATADFNRKIRQAHGFIIVNVRLPFTEAPTSVGVGCGWRGWRIRRCNEYLRQGKEGNGQS